MTDATITFDLLNALGVPFDARRTKVWVTFNTDDGWIVDEDGDLRVDAGTATITDAGLVTISGIPVPGVTTNPTDWQVKIHYDVPLILPGVRGITRKRDDFGWMTVTEDATLDELIAEQYVPPTWLTSAQATLQAIVDDGIADMEGFVDQGQTLLDAQITLSGIDDTDSAVAGLIDNPLLGPLTRAALTASIDQQVIEPAGAAAKHYSKGDQAYNVTDSSLRNWRRALSKCERIGSDSSEPASVVCGIDSMTEGATLNTVNKTWPAVLRAQFARIFPAAGSGIVHMLTPTWFQQDGSNNVDNRVNRIGTWSAVARGAYLLGCIRATGSSNKLAFTETGSQFVLYYLKEADGGTLSVDVDGGTPHTIDTSGSGIGVHRIVNTIATDTGGTPLSAGSHVVTVTAPSSGYAYVLGFEAVQSSTSGVRVTRAAKTGEQIAGLSGSEESMATVIDLAAPDLFIGMGIDNDYLNGHTAVATFKSRWATVVDRVRAGGGDVLLVIPPPPEDMSLTPPWEDYVEALYELADEKDVALLNLETRWGPSEDAQADGLMSVDGYHPNGMGHRDIARAVYEVIGSKAPGTTGGTLATLSDAQTFSARQTFGAGLTIASGQTLTVHDVSISRPGAAKLAVAGAWGAQRGDFGSTTPSNTGTVNIRANTGSYALSAYGNDGTLRGGFDNSGYLFVRAADWLSTAPGAATKGIPVKDQNGTVGYVAWTPA